jgi:maltose O-acetyltransferase
MSSASPRSSPRRKVQPQSPGACGGVTWATRAARAFVRETAFDLRKTGAQVISRGLPQFSFNRTRTLLLRAMGFHIGASSMVKGPLIVTGDRAPTDLISIGGRTTISGPLYIDLGAPVVIGNDVTIGHHVSLLTVDHEMGPSEARCGRVMVAPIVIEDGTWIASHVTVLPGVTIGRGAVVATGAVVAQNVPADTFVAGVPAKAVRHLKADAPHRSARMAEGAGTDEAYDRWQANK